MRPLVLSLLLLAGCPETRAHLVGADADDDGFHSGIDCDDDDASVSPGETEVPHNGIDDDCDEATPDDDVDGDGFGEAEDCDDTDARRFPGATEVCNGLDDDCDLEIDEGLGATWYADADADGFGDPDVEAIRCDADGGAWVRNALDCDDLEDAVNPAADEECNDRDDDCDGAIDTDAVSLPTWYADADGDLFGDADEAVIACEAPPGHVANPDDCDDTPGTGAAVRPGAIEVCNARDDDCDGGVDIDAQGAPTFFFDHDGDGYGTPDRTLVACANPDVDRWVDNDDDCYDFLATANPLGTEICNGVDDDCDGTPDDAPIDRATWYRDLDGDGFGDPVTSALRCDDDGGAWVANALDCDDTAGTGPSAYPGGAETCDGRDNDCNGVDDDVPGAPLWFEDFDEDGFGDPTSVVVACADPSDGTTFWVADSSDCDDLDEEINPDAVETCDQVDQDCDGLVDDGAAPLLSWYVDGDGDGFGDVTSLVTGCSAPTPEHVGNSTDCDDLDPDTHPGATQACSLVDNDCDAQTVVPSATACEWGTTCLDVLERFPGWLGTDRDFLIDPEDDGNPAIHACDMTPTGGRPGAGWTRLSFETFEDSSVGAWSWDPAGATGPSAPQVTNCGGQWGRILAVPSASATAGGILYRDFDDVPHDEVWISMNYLQIDTWDGEFGYLAVFAEPDPYEYLLWASAFTAPGAGTNSCGAGGFDVRHTVTEHGLTSVEPLTVMAGSTLNQAPGDETFGIDNVEVWVR